MFHDTRTLLPIDVDLHELNKYFDLNWQVVEYNPKNKLNPFENIIDIIPSKMC